jgi:hypothetical protein
MWHCNSRGLTSEHRACCLCHKGCFFSKDWQPFLVCVWDALHATDIVSQVQLFFTRPCGFACSILWG